MAKTKYDPHKIKFLTQAETKALFSVIRNKRDRALFLVAYRHGLRASEIGILRVEDVDFTEGRIRVSRLKGSMPGVHLMQSDELRALRAWLKESKIVAGVIFKSNRKAPISRRTLDYLMKTYGERAGLPPEKRHFHCLKHSIATHMLDADIDIMAVKDWLGHRSLRNTLIYSVVTSRKRDDTAQKIGARMQRF